MRKAVIFTVLFFVVWASTIYATPGDTLWTHTYGDSLNESIISAQQTSDGGYVAAGYTYSYGSGLRDVYVIKVDSQGDTMWTRAYGGVNEDGTFEIQQTSDGGYVIIGYTESFGAGSQDFYLIKTDSNGDTLWTHTYGGIGYDQGGSVQQTSDGGYILTGLTKSYGAGNSDVYLIKTDANGDTIWTRTFGGAQNDVGCTVRQTSDGGYVIAGYTYSFGAGGSDVIVIQTNPLGNALWTKTYGGTGDDASYYISIASDGGYVLAGDTDSYGAGTYDAYLIKIDATGDTLWTRTHGGSDWDVTYCVQETSDGGYLFSGFYAWNLGEGISDVYLIKTDINGDSLWIFTYGGTGDDGAYYAMETPDGGYFVAGGSDSYGAGGYDFYLLKFEALPCLACDAISQSPRVPNVDGTIIWDLKVENCGIQSTPVYAEIYPTVGDCASGTQYDFNINRLAVNNLAVGDSSTLYYWYRPGTVTGVIDAAISVDVGTAIDDYIGNCCFEFIFAYEFGRPGTEITFGPGEWGEREDDFVLPSTTSLNQNYPNPFNATTNLSFDISKSGDVDLSIYNLKGQRIETLINRRIDAGHYNVTWDASMYSSGVYFYKLTTSDKTYTKRMTLLK